MAASTTPIAVASGLRRIGEDLATWRRLRRLTAAQVADRAGVSRHTVMRLENGAGAGLESVLRVARALGLLDSLVVALDPYATDVGRMRSEEALPERVDRKSTRLNSSHLVISYAVFCLKKKN